MVHVLSRICMGIRESAHHIGVSSLFPLIVTGRSYKSTKMEQSAVATNYS
jgi:hypothetical protein